MTKEEEILYNRFSELAEIAYSRSIITHTDFLNLNELSLFEYKKREFSYIKSEQHGGYNQAERRIISFIPEYIISEIILPISCIEVIPVNKKFSDELNHRDYLGAVLNLGIDRGKVGDIITHDNMGYIFILSGISEYIVENLTKIKHTNVSCSIKNEVNLDIVPKFKIIKGTVSSNRLDSVISLAFSKSRNNVIGLIEGGKVFVNSKLTEKNHYILKENDMVSVRGQGKFIYKEAGQQTRKGRLMITLHKYI